MKVSEMIKKLAECDLNADVFIVRVTKTGGCSTCGHGAWEDKSEVRIDDVYDLETRVEIVMDSDLW